MTDLPSNLVEYLTARADERSARADDMWAALTPREQALVKEATVVGFYHGYAYHGPEYPKDSTVLEMALLTADSMSDLYPTLSALAAPSDEFPCLKCGKDVDDVAASSGGEFTCPHCGFIDHI